MTPHSLSVDYTEGLPAKEYTNRTEALAFVLRRARAARSSCSSPRSSSLTVATLPGDLLIVTLPVADRRLAAPVYYFLRHFALLELGFPSAVHRRCRPTSSRDAGPSPGPDAPRRRGSPSSWARRSPCCCAGLRGGRLLFLTGPGVWVLSVPFCGPGVLHHFFRDSAPLLALACAHTGLLQLVRSLVAVRTPASAVLVTGPSHGCLVATVLHLPSSGGRSKAFSACSSHILVVSLTYGSCAVMYLSPTQTGRLQLKKGLAFLNTTVWPLLNPFISCLGNELVQKAGRGMPDWSRSFQCISRLQRALI
nr:olfactory receptor 6C3-like [Equus asinus]